MAGAFPGSGEPSSARKRMSSPRSVVFFNEGMMRDNVNRNDGALTYQLRMVRP